jgi:hypothetical protein
VLYGGWIEERKRQSGEDPEKAGEQFALVSFPLVFKPVAKKEINSNLMTIRISSRDRFMPN